MANKRSLKKQIGYVSAEVLAQATIADALIDGVDKNRLNKAIADVLKLQGETRSRVNIAFDKAPKDFENLKAYHKARREYYAKAYAALRESYNSKLQEVVKEMNAAMPKAEK